MNKKPMSIYLPDTLNERIREAAEEEGRPVGNFVVWVLKKYIESKYPEYKEKNPTFARKRILK